MSGRRLEKSWEFGGAVMNFVPDNPRAGIYETVGHCEVDGCGKPMVSKHAWDAGIRKPDHVAKGGLGMCRTHYARWMRHGSTEKRIPVGRGSTRQQAARRSRDEVLEEYLMIKDDVSSIAQAAQRMGMTFSALDKALYRARLDGDRRAMPPLNQVDLATLHGSTYPSSAA